MGKYYAITTSMLFEKTVLVPVDSVKDIDEAIELVDAAVEVSEISLLSEDAEFETKPSTHADSEGIYELTDSDAEFYQIIGNDSQKNEYLKVSDGFFTYYVNTKTGEKKHELDEDDIEVEGQLDDLSR